MERSCDMLFVDKHALEANIQMCKMQKRWMKGQEKEGLWWDYSTGLDLHGTDIKSQSENIQLRLLILYLLCALTIIKVEISQKAQHVIVLKKFFVLPVSSTLTQNVWMF